MEGNNNYNDNDNVQYENLQYENTESESEFVEDDRNTDIKSWLNKNKKIIIAVITVVAIILIIYFSISSSKTPPSSSNTPPSSSNTPQPITPNINSLELNPFNPRGHLFGPGYNQTLELKINKSIEEVTGICYPKCLNDPLCTGFGYSIAPRFDNRPNGDCWFMTGPIKYVDQPENVAGGVKVAGTWIKKK